jgi:hypothetical protein
VQIPEQIAQALAPAAATTTLAKLTALKAPTALPSLAPKMVTLPTAVDSKTTATTADGTAAATADGAAATAASNAGSLKTKGDDTKGAAGAVGEKHTKGAAGADGAKHTKGTRGADGAKHTKGSGGHEGKSGGGHEGKSGSHHE